MADFEGAASPDGLGGGHSFPTGPSEEQSFGDAEGDADSAFGGSPRSGSGSTATGASESYNMDSASQADDDGMITVRAHNKKVRPAPPKPARVFPRRRPRKDDRRPRADGRDHRHARPQGHAHEGGHVKVRPEQGRQGREAQVRPERPQKTADAPPTHQ
jgi:hypothetical protein